MRQMRPALLLTLALLTGVLAGCARPGAYRSYGGVPYDGYDPAAEGHSQHRAPRRYYPPPGSPQDQWGPYIREAAARFRVPEQWIRAVMRQESGGHEQATSPVGAMGLMQVMPATYETLRVQHHLGDDPYDPHNSILAGAAYIREMYDRYGAPGFLAAYNAGPDRVDRYLAGSDGLPDETVNYLAAITPNLGNGVPLSGPLAAYAAGGVREATPTVVSLASGCDANAAYDPDRPCAPLEQAAVLPAPLQRVAVGGCDPDAAFDPDRRCQSVSASALRSAAYQPPLTAAGGGWAIQVGAFASVGLARAVAEGARTEAPDQLRAATIALPATTPFGGSVLYRARLAHLSADAASNACARLNQRQLPCVVVQPTGS